METQASYFVRKGFVALVPTRIGYGSTAGLADPEDSGSCAHEDYRAALKPAVTQILAALDYGRSLPDVDKKRLLLVGQSVDGISTTAAAAQNPAGVLAAINFAGGKGGDPDKHPGKPCAAPQLESVYAEFGKASRIPMLWIYTENDKYFGPGYSQDWAQAYRAGGAPLDYRLLPPFGDNGHALFAQGADIWMPLLESYLAGLGFSRPGYMKRPAASGYAALEDRERIPYLSASARQDGYGRFLAATEPRAFAINPEGHWGYANGGNATDRAVENCQRRSAKPCALYAVDKDVVWSGGGH